MLLSEGSVAAGALSMLLMFLVWALIWIPIIYFLIKFFKKLFRLMDSLNYYLELKINDIEHKEK